MTDDRTLKLEGVHNFRDFGGYALGQGGRLQRGLLWRSGQHHEATDADLAQIDALGLTRVFDLRSDRERFTHPCRRPDGFSAKIHFVEDGTAQQAPHVAAASGPRRDAATARENMRRSYRGMPYRPKLNEAIRTYLRALAEGEGASLVNCMAGKDRTGFAVAMVQHAAGVHFDDILADYVLTNQAGDPVARIAAGHRATREILGNIDDDALRVIMGVEPEYLETAFATIREDHGSIDAYQREVLELDDALRDRLRDRLGEG